MKIERFVSWNYSFGTASQREEFTKSFLALCHQIAYSYGYEFTANDNEKLNFKDKQVLLDAFLQAPIDKGIIRNGSTPTFPEPLEGIVGSGPTLEGKPLPPRPPKAAP